MMDGLSTLPRVEELVSVMQKQKDSILTITGDDATRQWPTFLGILATIENEDCLDHFVRLNGFCLLNQWLQECQKCDKNVGENLLGGMITSILATLEKLPPDREKLALSGISATVERLLGHKNLNIKEKAKSLSGKWKDMDINVVSCHNLVDRVISLDDQPKPSTNGNREVEPICAEVQHLNVTRYSDSSQVETTKDVKSSLSDQSMPRTWSNFAGADTGIVNSLGSPLISDSCPENISVTEGSFVYPAPGSNDPCSSPVCRDITVYIEVSDAKEREMKVNTEEASPCKSSREESGDVSSSDLSASLPSSSVGDSKGSDGGVDFVFHNGSSTGETKAIGEIDHESGVGLEFEEIDALEMARQVALEVEREVVDYREPFCSSPEANSGETIDTHSCDEGKQDQMLMGDLDDNMLPVVDDASSPKDHKCGVSHNTVFDPQEHEQLAKSPNETCAAHGSALDFDLNEDVCTKEFDCSMNLIPSILVNLSAPKAVVAPKGAPTMSAKPLQFGGEMRWKGSGATSAFRPAARRIPDCIKTCPDLRQRQNILEIDLNLAGSEDDVAVDPMKQMPSVSWGLPSGDSSVEVSSRRSERLKLDLNLNRLGDEDMSTCPSLYWRLHHQNGDQSLSSASSSSSRQPSLREFDLNDNPCFFDKSSSKASTMTNGSTKLEDPVVTIMGSRMAVERKDYLNQGHQSFLVGNGLNMEAMWTPRPMLPYYAHMPLPYGYNGHPMGHGPTMPIHPSFYGHGGIPYMMVESRGGTVIPQVVGSVGLNVTGAPASRHGVRPPWSGYDLNSCMASIESGGSRPPFVHSSHNGVMEEHMRITSQPSSSGVQVKRKEPDCGWEPRAALGYKQVTSWQ